MPNKDSAKPVPAQRVETAATAGTPYRAALVLQEVQVVADGGRYRCSRQSPTEATALGVLEEVPTTYTWTGVRNEDW